MKVRFLLLSLFALASAERVSAASNRTNHFRVVMNSLLSSKGAGTPQRTVAKTEISYSWVQREDDRVLYLRKLSVQAKLDGKVQMDTDMSRDEFVDRSQGILTRREDAPAPLRTLLEDSFGSPICVLRESGPEGRKIELVARRGAGLVTKQGMVENALLFHPLFKPKAKVWKQASRIPVGHGGFTEGDLTLRQKSEEGAHTTVTVAGKLEKKEIALPNNFGRLVDIVHDVQGEMTHDAKLNEWVSGALNIKVSFGMEIRGAGGRNNSSGTMKVRFNRVGQ